MATSDPGCKTNVPTGAAAEPVVPVGERTKWRGRHRSVTAALRRSLSVAITRSFGLCSLFGAGTAQLLVRLSRWIGTCPGENAEATVTPPASGLVLRGIYNIRASFCGSLHKQRHRTASSNDAANEIWCAEACGFCSYARRPGFGKESRGFCESQPYFCVRQFAAAF
jgi:hypothetical protein